MTELPINAFSAPWEDAFRSQSDQSWDWRPNRKVECLLHFSDAQLDVTETESKSRSTMGARDRLRASWEQRLEDLVAKASAVLPLALPHAKDLLRRLPKDLLADSDLDVDVTNAGFIAFTWHREDSIAIISVGARPELHFSTVNRSGQRVRGCKTFDKLGIVVESIRDA